MTATATHRSTEIVELDARESNGISVALLWLRGTSLVRVHVDDLSSGASFEIDVEPSLALDAFRHPFAYAALAGQLDEVEEREQCAGTCA